MAQRDARFDRVASNYSQARPRYPAPLIADVAGNIAAVPMHEGGFVADIGCGTGAFARALRAALPSHLAVIGVEPNPVMRAQAEAETPPDAAITFVEGSAEALPFSRGSAVAVTAATAAHWFDRPRFYAEADRVLRPGGVLAIAEYVRDTAKSPLAAGLAALMAEHGSRRAYRAGIDYQGELDALPKFHRVTEYVLRQELRLRTTAFIDLALSSSHAAGLIERLGEAGARAALRKLALPYLGDDEQVPFGYLFQCVTARRNP